jgi:imidazolonepropionase-like amidohydrolase
MVVDQAPWPTPKQVVAAGVDSVEHAVTASTRTTWPRWRTGVARGRPRCAPRSTRIPMTTTSGVNGGLLRRERLRRSLVAADRLGVTILAGSDIVGTVPREVALLTELGLSPQAALAAAGTAARSFLGIDGLAPGRPADLVTYHHDPRTDPETLARPAAVVSGGRRIR